MNSISGKIAGVYGILHTSTSRIYVGSAVKVYHRWYDHQSKLRIGKHENTYLQRAWDKYGESAFEWLLLEIVSDYTQLISTEQKWIDHFQSTQREKGFNIYPTAGSPLGRKMTEEQSRQHSIRLRALKRKQSEYQKQTVSKALQGNKHGAGKHYCGVLTETDVLNIFHLLASGHRIREVATLFNVHTATIKRIGMRETWTNVPIPDTLLYAAQRTVKLGHRGRANTKLSENDVRLIKSRLVRGDSVCIIAKEYRVTDRTINCIRQGITWSHVTDFIPLSGPPIRLRAPKLPKS